MLRKCVQLFQPLHRNAESFLKAKRCGTPVWAGKGYVVGCGLVLEQAINFST